MRYHHQGGDFILFSFINIDHIPAVCAIEFLTPASLAARSRKLYVAPGSRLPTVHCSSDPWYTSAGLVSPSLISRLNTHSSHTPSETGESMWTEKDKEKHLHSHFTFKGDLMTFYINFTFLIKTYSLFSLRCLVLHVYSHTLGFYHHEIK